MPVDVVAAIDAACERVREYRTLAPWDRDDAKQTAALEGLRAIPAARDPHAVARAILRRKCRDIIRHRIGERAVGCHLGMHRCSFGFIGRRESQASIAAQVPRANLPSPDTLRFRAEQCAWSEAILEQLSPRRRRYVRTYATGEPLTPQQRKNRYQAALVARETAAAWGLLARHLL